MATLVFDIDGTLLDEKGNLSPNLITFFSDYTRSHRVFLATGKSLAETKQFVKRAKIQGAVLITNGGASAYDMRTKRVLLSNFISQDDKRFISHVAATNAMAIVAFAEKGSSAYAFSSRLQGAAQMFAPLPRFYDDYYAFARRLEADKVYNIWLLVNYLEKDYKKMSSAVAASINKRGSVYTLLTRNDNLIVFNNNASKLAGLSFALAKFKLTLSNCIYFGDGVIDADCIKHVGWGIAVGNADESVKKAADVVIEPVSSDGVYNWLMANKPIWTAAKLEPPPQPVVAEKPSK